MVTFGSGYYMPMDREYGKADDRKEAATNDVGLNIGDIGVSMGLGVVPNIPAVAARLRGGTKVAELTFMGAHRGSAQGHTAEMYGQTQRQALRELQKANQIQFTTHASVGVQGLAGMDQQGSFSKHNKSMAIDEIKKAIDFAADVTKGGAVVLHSGEFFRPISEARWNDGRFQMFEQEKEYTTFKVVDTRTGAVVHEARKSRDVTKPVWKVYNEKDDLWKEKKEKESFIDEKGQVVKVGDYIDYMGNKVLREDRVPVFDHKEQRFLTRQVGWDEVVEDAKKLTAEAKDAWRKFKSGEINEKELNEKTIWGRFKDARSEKDIEVKPEEAYIISTLETTAANHRGWAYYYGGNFEKHIDMLKKLEKARKLYEQIEQATSEEDKWKLKQEMRAELPFLPSESKMPVEQIDEQIKHLKTQIDSSRESSSAQWTQAEETKETMRHVQSAENYALKESYDGYAQAGIYAWRRTQDAKQKGRAKEDIFVAMENLFPESYGAHPQELIGLVKKSREVMAEKLVNNFKVSEEEAKGIAERHIAVTFDTGHFNMWRKYWKGDSSKTLEDNDKEFNKWFLGQVEDLAKNKIVKHLHLVDNYGYQDEHLSPGQGNAPVRDAVQIFKKYGFDGKIMLEPGSASAVDSNQFSFMTNAWSYFGNPIYGGTGAGVSAGRQWKEVQYGYFGQNQTPYFTVGPYAPSEDWTLWSGTPLD